MSLTELGYHRPTYDEILENKEQLARNLFGEDIDTGEQTPLGKFIRIGAYDLSKAYEDIENVYYARFPNTASGISLDRLCVFVGISRNPATLAEYSVTVTGDAGTQVNELIVCGENPDITFHNIEPFTVGEDGKVTITVECDEYGTVGNGITINEIVNPIANIDGVGEGIQTLAADDVESDYDLRRRLAQAVEGAGGSSLSAVRAAVLKVSTVKSVSIVENTTNFDDAEGRPPHSFETYVYGGEDYPTEIAQAIFDVKPLGIHTVGNKSVTIMDVSGDEQTVNYSPATTINVLVKMSIKTDEDFPSDGVEQIKANVADRINSLDLGESLVLSRLYGCAYRVGGVSEVTLLQASTDDGGTYSSDNIAVSAHNVAISSGVAVEVVS